jgi:hypothetical protein
MGKITDCFRNKYLTENCYEIEGYDDKNIEYLIDFVNKFEEIENYPVFKNIIKGLLFLTVEDMHWVKAIELHDTDKIGSEENNCMIYYLTDKQSPYIPYIIFSYRGNKIEGDWKTVKNYVSLLPSITGGINY